MNVPERRRLFDDWAEGYDAQISATEHTFPYGGYESVLDEVVRQAGALPGHVVLDLGIGTGKLSVKFAASGCSMYGWDFSEPMLAQARLKLPDAALVRADLSEEWPPLLERRFDRIVSSYALHEFDLASKIRLLRRAVDHLCSAGRIVVGDIAFSSRADYEAAHVRWFERWDDDEWYWVADEAIAACRDAGLHARYTQVSDCGGVFVVTPEEV